MRLVALAWVMTGKAQSIQTIGELLRERRSPMARLMVKTYWAEDKKGLDYGRRPVPLYGRKQKLHEFRILIFTAPDTYRSTSRSVLHDRW